MGRIVRAEAQQQSSAAVRTARWNGALSLGGEDIECYVLDDGTRVIGLTSAIRSTAGDDKGNIAKIAGVLGLRGHLDFDAMAEAFVEFAIPGFTLQNGKGMTTEWFERLLTAYVDAALDPDVVLTPKQRLTARRCQTLQRGLIRTGLDALVDEATGYQNVRADDALQFKLRAFIAEEFRGWEKTFPDDLWNEFGRLSGWADPLRNRPQWWGKLVVWLIYDTLDEDVAIYLRQNRPPPGTCWHQRLTEDFGVRALTRRCDQVIGIAKTCVDMDDLREKVALHYGTKVHQLTFTEMLNAPRMKPLYARHASIDRKDRLLPRSGDVAEVVMFPGFEVLQPSVKPQLQLP